MRCIISITQLGSSTGFHRSVGTPLYTIEYRRVVAYVQLRLCIFPLKVWFEVPFFFTSFGGLLDYLRVQSSLLIFHSNMIYRFGLHSSILFVMAPYVQPCWRLPILPSALPFTIFMLPSRYPLPSYLPMAVLTPSPAPVSLLVSFQ